MFLSSWALTWVCDYTYPSWCVWLEVMLVHCMHRELRDHVSCSPCLWVPTAQDLPYRKHSLPERMISSKIHRKPHCRAWGHTANVSTNIGASLRHHVAQTPTVMVFSNSPHHHLPPDNSWPSFLKNHRKVTDLQKSHLSPWLLKTQLVTGSL